MQKEKHNPSGTQAVSYIVKLDTYLNLRFPVHISFPKRKQRGKKDVFDGGIKNTCDLP